MVGFELGKEVEKDVFRLVSSVGRRNENFQNYKDLSILMRLFRHSATNFFTSFAENQASFYFHLWTLFLFIFLHSHASFKRRRITEIFARISISHQNVLENYSEINNA